jgi:tRNA(Arg) A34 adenosine deaminase TadA
MTEADERNLRRAVELAAAARAVGDMPFGALFVGHGGDVLAEDRNTVLTERHHDPSRAQAGRWTARQLEPEAARQATTYTSCRPRPMCTGAIARSGLGRVVFAFSGEQLRQLRPPGSVGPDAAQVA